MGGRSRVEIELCVCVVYAGYVSLCVCVCRGQTGEERGEVQGACPCIHTHAHTGGEPVSCMHWKIDA